MSASTYAPVTAETRRTRRPVGATGCDRVPFAPTVSLTPSTTQRDTPDGADGRPPRPPGPDPADIATSHLRESDGHAARGLDAEPGGGVGLQACTDAQFAAGTNGLACPAASQVGTAEITTPGPRHALTGALYVGSAPLGRTRLGPEYRVFLDAENATAGVDVRLSAPSPPTRHGPADRDFSKPPRSRSPT